MIARLGPGRGRSGIEAASVSDENAERGAKSAEEDERRPGGLAEAKTLFVLITY
jgi:hypothetical protein